MRAGVCGAAAILAAAFGAFPASAHECFKPVQPILIDKNTALPEERNAMTARIDAFIRETNQYLACLERSDAQARSEAQRLIDAWAQPDEAIEVVTD